MSNGLKPEQLVKDIDQAFLTSPEPLSPSRFEGYAEADDDSSHLWEKPFGDLTLEDFELSTFSLSDCYPEARVFFLGVALKLSLKARRFEIEPIKNLFVESQKNRQKPITERNRFLIENLNYWQKELFLAYCRIALDSSDPSQKYYWQNLLGDTD